MNTPSRSLSIRRIVVALDCSPHSRASLDAAAAIAKVMNAELSGIYVEDINLLRIADLPCDWQTESSSAKERQLDPLQVERSLRMQAKEASRMLGKAAMELNLTHTFRTLRGLVSAEVLNAALDSDLLVLGRAGKTPVCRRTLGTTAKKAITEGQMNVLLMRKGFSLAGPLLVLFDGSEGSETALRTAQALSAERSVIHVLLLANSPSSAAVLRKKAEAVTEVPDKRLEFHEIPWSGMQLLLQCIGMIDTGLLVIADLSSTLPAESIRELIEKLNYPVLLIRSRNAGPS
ncbi:universal stress protein [Prosthecochloris sp. HL-130-GSB]|jgi:nucleotide-binding universal stress UspA family protein|uniref:universal stress protein n=1 Tax=Prosthecochloris sp. HL-130-GSB TaxID=1974213 RepID=UPI000A1C0BAE|nr:universal stress protein [Prosthecochloris sp. HL-130-GSB]ARM31508.1 hypothetical protein B9H02_09640 [Prosthecochloris sp. HL-130-GSB]